MQRMIELMQQANGGHRNQTCHGVVPEGWAVIPEVMETENFPFGIVTAEALPCPGGENAEEDTVVMTVTGWEPLPMPEPEPEGEAAPSVWDELDAAYREGVNDV